MFSNSEAKDISKLNYLQGIYECEKKKQKTKENKERRWRRDRDLFESQIPVTTGRFELQISIGIEVSDLKERSKQANRVTSLL